MASVSATCLCLRASPYSSNTTTQGTRRISSTKLVSIPWKNSGFRSFRITCAAKPETVQKVCDIVRKQLALPPETELTPASKFSALGADSLDTVEIVMGLEEEFDISVEEESSENITTVQEAADLIEKLVQKKAEA
ncbi:hypothetical protein SLEP1_g27924 [Rubroshorea leprosula]|uniref:Acyl carrier protein n=1 Tax=Rubroshorea leprosula TaxID=152421 RepID=A0AAV5JRX4_9ROSI|nr:hypothetical protein SLEP1_g27924 [Rubroshorea leprosula]